LIVHECLLHLGEVVEDEFEQRLALLFELYLVPVHDLHPSVLLLIVDGHFQTLLEVVAELGALQRHLQDEVHDLVVRIYFDQVGNLVQEEVEQREANPGENLML